MSGKDTSVQPLPEEISSYFFSLLHYLESIQHSDTNINFQITGKDEWILQVSDLHQLPTVQINAMMHQKPSSTVMNQAKENIHFNL